MTTPEFSPAAIQQAPRWPGLRSTCVAAAGLALLALTGCSDLQPPQPWEKGDLARAEMRMDGDPLEARFRAHVYASKEGASGGAGVGGGGCGCN